MDRLIQDLKNVISDKPLAEARENQIVAAVHIVAKKVDEYDIPMEYEARLWDVARKVPMDPGMGVKPVTKDKDAAGALMKMAQSFKRSGFLEDIDLNGSLDLLGRLLDEADESEGAIKALGETDYRDKDAFFKMVQLLKGLAVASENDEQAKKFMSAVSDALTSAAEKVLKEDGDDSDGAMLERVEKMHRGEDVLKSEYKMLGKALKRKFVGRMTPYGEIVDVSVGMHGSTGSAGKIQKQHMALGGNFIFTFEKWDTGEINIGSVGFIRLGKDLGKDFDVKFRTPSGKEYKGKVRQDNIEADLVAFVKGSLKRAAKGEIGESDEV